MSILSKRLMLWINEIMFLCSWGWRSYLYFLDLKINYSMGLLKSWKNKQRTNSQRSTQLYQFIWLSKIKKIYFRRAKWRSIKKETRKNINVWKNVQWFFGSIIQFLSRGSLHIRFFIERVHKSWFQQTYINHKIKSYM